MTDEAIRKSTQLDYGCHWFVIRFFFYFYSFSVLCVMRVTIKQTEDIFIQECSVRSVEIVLYRFTRAPFSRMLDQR